MGFFDDEEKPDVGGIAVPGTSAPAPAPVPKPTVVPFSRRGSSNFFDEAPHDPASALGLA